MYVMLQAFSGISVVILYSAAIFAFAGFENATVAVMAVSGNNCYMNILNLK
jgi:hypothetical protein